MKTRFYFCRNSQEVVTCLSILFVIFITSSFLNQFFTLRAFGIDPRTYSSSLSDYFLGGISFMVQGTYYLLPTVFSLIFQLTLLISLIAVKSNALNKRENIVTRTIEKIQQLFNNEESGSHVLFLLYVLATLGYVGSIGYLCHPISSFHQKFFEHGYNKYALNAVGILTYFFCFTILFKMRSILTVITAFLAILAIPVSILCAGAVAFSAYNDSNPYELSFSNPVLEAKYGNLPLITANADYFFFLNRGKQTVEVASRNLATDYYFAFGEIKPSVSRPF